MRQQMNAPVSVIWKYDNRTNQITLIKIRYDGTEYKIVRIGLHYTEWEGRTLRHIFCCAGDSCFFKLALDTKTLFWTLEEFRNYAHHLVE